MTTNGRTTWTADLDRLGDDALEEVNRLWTIAQVLSNTAHAVRNSLQVSSGNAELMEAREGLDPALLRRVQTIRAQSARAAEALEWLLAYSRPSSPSIEAVEVGDLLRVALDMRAHSLGRARITVEVKDADAGPCGARTRRRDLLQLLLNILLATEGVVAGWTGAKIVVQLSRHGSEVEIEVTGQGTPASTAPDGPSGEFGPERQGRVMLRLAEGLGAVLHRGLSAEGWPTCTLTLPGSHGVSRV